MKIFLSEKLRSIIFFRKLRNSHKKRLLCIRIYGSLKPVRKNRKVNSIFFNRVADKDSDQIVEIKKAFETKKTPKDIMI